MSTGADFKCRTPVETHGTNSATAVTSTVQAVKPSSACKPLTSTAPAGGAIARVANGYCSLALKAKHVAQAGFTGMLVTGKKKPKAASRSGDEHFFPVPVVIVADKTPPMWKQLPGNTTMTIRLEVSYMSTICAKGSHTFGRVFRGR